MPTAALQVRDPLLPFSSKKHPAFSRYQTQYLRKDEPDGSWYLVENGKIDIYEMIQSFKEDTEYSVILQKMENGDPNALSRYQNMLLENAGNVAEGIQEGVFPDFKTIMNSFCAAREFYDDNGGEDAFGVSFDKFFKFYEFGSKSEEPKKDEGAGSSGAGKVGEK